MTNLNSTSFALPQHPLPEEIQQMKRNETVCKFCGVSYLILSEVKALQEKLAEAERQVEYYKGSVDREKVLKEKLENMDGEFLEQSQRLKEQDQQLELFKSDLKMKAKLINDMYLQKRQHESTLAKEQSKSEKLSACILQVTSMVGCLKECLNNLKKDVVEYKMSSKKMQMYFSGNIGKFTERLKNKVEQERKESKTNREKMSEQLLNCEAELNILREADSKLVDLETKYLELKNKLDIYEKHATQLEEGNKTLREKNTVIENQLIQKSNDERDLKNHLETVKKEKQEDHVKHKELLKKKEEELKKLSTLCKSLEKLMNEKSVVEKEVRDKVTDKDIQIKNLEETVNKMRVDSGKTKMEREQTIVSHHNRIEQLRESYVKKLEASEQTCRALENDLDELKQKDDTIQKEFRRSIREEFEQEIKALNLKHSQEVDILKVEVKNLEDKLEKEKNAVLTIKQEINQLKNRLSTNKTRNAQESQKYQNEILDLRRNLEVLQYEQPKTDKDEEVKVLKSKYQAIQITLKDAKTQMKMLEQTLTAKNSEMTVLQDTVRRECEERLELTQALSDTRMQLLSLQQNPEAPRQFPSTKRLTNRPTVNKTDRKTAVNSVETSASHDVILSETSEIIASRARRIKSTGSESPRATRESVNSFRERIAAALGRDSRFNHTR